MTAGASACAAAEQLVGPARGECVSQLELPARYRRRF